MLRAGTTTERRLPVRACRPVAARGARMVPAARLAWGLPVRRAWRRSREPTTGRARGRAAGDAAPARAAARATAQAAAPCENPSQESAAEQERIRQEGEE